MMKNSRRMAMAQLREMESVRWYRGMSSEQMRASDNLLHALRDDSEQGSAYRVHKCLRQLGLKPLIGQKKLKQIMELSRGNDLALLWFVWEAHYKQPGAAKERYTVNEQLLLSAIAHLDMLSTLRELDRILPPPSHSTIYQKVEQDKLAREERRRSAKQNQKSQDNDLPYFEMLPRPMRLTASLELKPDVLRRKMLFPDYSRYKNKMYQIPNERSRWYSHYELSPAKRITKKILSAELDRLLLGDGPVALESLCDTHRFQQEQRAQRQQELANMALERCLDLLDVPGAEQRDRRQRIVRQLELEVEDAAKKLRAYSRQLSHTLKGDSRTCQVCTQLQPALMHVPDQKANLALLMGLDLEQGMQHVPGVLNSPVQVLKMDINSGAQPSSAVQKQVVVKPRLQKKSSSTRVHGRQRSSSNRSSVHPEHMSRPTGDLSNRDERKGEQFFKINSILGIPQLDYFKVFDFPLDTMPSKVDLAQGEYTVENKQPLIKQLCIEALNKTLVDEIGPELWPDACPQQPNSWLGLMQLLSSPVVEAADKCAVNMFRRDVELHPLSKQSSQCPCPQIPLEVESIDPNDKEKLTALLRAALDQMKVNPSYVLASFPNVHKMPLLQDWMADRYGKTYNRHDLEKMGVSSYLMYDTVKRKYRPKKLSLKEQLPTARLMKYSEQGVYHCQTTRIKTDYQNQLNNMVLEESRLIWLALRGPSYLNGCGSIRDTYFAYMASREAELYRHNVWTSHDYRNLANFRMYNRIKANAK